MATMWPKVLPREVLDNPLRFAEISVYERLAEVLNDQFTVFYSRPWLGLTSTGAERDGECDFLIAHEKFGILTLEVKGGAIAYDPKVMQWTSKDRRGIIHNIKDPVAQAKTAKHNILKVLHDSKKWQPHRIRARHGVVFPDCYVGKGDLSLEAPREIICSHDDFLKMSEWILKRMGATDTFEDGEHPFGKSGIFALEDLLARPFMLKTPIGYRLDDDVRALQALTPQQFHILLAIQDISKAGIAGGAGTGKTVLALESARRFADAGKKTLLVCYNQPLAAELKRKTKNIENIEAGSFHEFCLHFARVAEISFEVANTQEFFEETAPELMLEAVSRNPEIKFDVIIVDEGQDFPALWWIALEALLLLGEQARFHVFYDCNQKIYAGGGRPPGDVDLIPIRLSRNLRNTDRIHSVAMKHYSGYEILPNNIEGVAIESVVKSDFKSIVNWLDKRVKTLVESEKIAPSDIAILAANPERIGELRANGRLGGFYLSDAASPDETMVTVDTIRRFKGLERSVIILIVTEDLLRAVELAYVALTRPMSFLLLVGSEGVLTAIQNAVTLDPGVERAS